MNGSFLALIAILGSLAAASSPVDSGHLARDGCTGGLSGKTAYFTKDSACQPALHQYGKQYFCSCDKEYIVSPACTVVYSLPTDLDNG